MTLGGRFVLGGAVVVCGGGGDGDVGGGSSGSGGPGTSKTGSTVTVYRMIGQCSVVKQKHTRVENKDFGFDCCVLFPRLVGHFDLFWQVRGLDFLWL